jgi:hypothetical protein
MSISLLLKACFVNKQTVAFSPGKCYHGVMTASYATMLKDNTLSALGERAVKTLLRFYGCEEDYKKEGMPLSLLMAMYPEATGPDAVDNMICMQFSRLFTLASVELQRLEAKDPYAAFAYKESFAIIGDLAASKKTLVLLAKLKHNKRRITDNLHVRGSWRTQAWAAKHIGFFNNLLTQKPSLYSHPLIHCPERGVFKNISLANNSYQSMLLEVAQAQAHLIQYLAEECLDYPEDEKKYGFKETSVTPGRDVVDLFFSVCDGPTKEELIQSVLNRRNRIHRPVLKSKLGE